jgi:ABC-type sugar transport system ATPase subunit
MAIKDPDVSSRMKPDTVPLVRMIGISKKFGPVQVLKDVQLEILSGEVHVLAGENGAGKSTLMKILAGIHTDFEGTIELEGRAVRPRSPTEANALGIAVIHQELSLIGPMSVADNICLSDIPAVAGGWVKRGQQIEQAQAAVQRVGLTLDVRRPVEEFPIAVQQMIEIAKALNHQARVIVMDEPTSALSSPEVTQFFGQIERLKSQGCGIVYITHRMEEIERIADRITVMRDGQYVGTAPAAELPAEKIIQWMVGREISEQLPPREAQAGKELLRLEKFSVYPSGPRQAPTVREVSLSVRAGEIVGIGGLQGSGASDVLLGLFGAWGKFTTGSVWLEGKELAIESPKTAIRAGVALLTNDRKASGLVLPLSIIANSTLAALPRLSPGGWRRNDREVKATKDTAAAMKLRAASLEMETGSLSGGNQQKVALAKWWQTQPRLLLLDEPTRGIDVAAKREIYQLMSEWTATGVGILLISSEMPELLGLSDRIYVLHRGELTAHLDRSEATPETVLAAAMGQARPNSTSFPT